jgi:hypothetical protein
VLALSPNRSDECHDRNPVEEKLNEQNAIDSENINKPAPDIAKSKSTRKPAKKARSARKAGRAKKAAAKPKAERANMTSAFYCRFDSAAGARGGDCEKLLDQSKSNLAYLS